MKYVAKATKDRAYVGAATGANARLQELVEADDTVQAEQRKASGRGNRFEAMMARIRKPTPAADAGLALARHQGDAAALAAFTAGNIEGDVLDENYLAAKLGNGYMRRTLALFGMNAPATVMDKTSRPNSCLSAPFTRGNLEPVEALKVLPTHLR